MVPERAFPVVKTVPIPIRVSVSIYVILPTGNSGNPFSKHYKDQAEMFVNNEYRKMLMNKEEIESKSLDLLVLKPR